MNVVNFGVISDGSANDVSWGGPGAAGGGPISAPGAIGGYVAPTPYSSSAMMGPNSHYTMAPHLQDTMVS